MEATVVQPEKVQGWMQRRSPEIGVFRHQKWLDGEGRLWIVLLTFGHDNRGKFGNMVELLDVDNERTVDIPRSDFEHMAKSGILKRLEGPLIL